MSITGAHEDAGLALTLQYNKRGGKKNGFPSGEPTYADAIVTMSYSKILKIAEGEEFLGELLHGVNNFALFKIDTP